MEHCDHTICPVSQIPFLCLFAHKLWLFKKLIFELEASYSFKTTCILVWQVISLKKIDVAMAKICCLILWSPISTLSISVSASMKMASISVTVIYNNIRVDTCGKLPI